MCEQRPKTAAHVDRTLDTDVHATRVTALPEHISQIRMKQTSIHCSQTPIKGWSHRCRLEVIIFIKNYFGCSAVSEHRTNTRGKPKLSPEAERRQQRGRAV